MPTEQEPTLLEAEENFIREAVALKQEHEKQLKTLILNQNKAFHPPAVEDFYQCRSTCLTNPKLSLKAKKKMEQGWHFTGLNGPLQCNELLYPILMTFFE